MADSLQKCPYCLDGSPITGDHIFPRFLGGRAEIPACKECNDFFGRSFEAATSEPLKEVMLLLRFAGLKPPGPIRWRNVLFPDGKQYDLDHDLNGAPSQPVISKNDDGRIINIDGGRHHVTKIIQSAKKKGYLIGKEVINSTQAKPPKLIITFPIDHNLRRLAIKMSIAAVRRTGLTLTLDKLVREFLLTRAAPPPTFSAPVRIDVTQYPELEQLRPKAGHLVYVHSDAISGRCYSIVQLFSAFQFYCDLGAASGDFAVVATHDPVTHNEMFKLSEAYSYPMPLQHLSQEVWIAGIRTRFKCLRDDMVSLFGEKGLLQFDL